MSSRRCATCRVMTSRECIERSSPREPVQDRNGRTDGGQRVPQLMTQHRQKLILRSAACLRLLARRPFLLKALGISDPDGSVVGQGLEEG